MVFMGGQENIQFWRFLYKMPKSYFTDLPEEMAKFQFRKYLENIMQFARMISPIWFIISLPSKKTTA